MPRFRSLDEVAASLNATHFVPKGVNVARVLGVDRPLFLINIRPFMVLNAVHWALFQRIAMLQEQGCRVSVIMYDASVLNATWDQDLMTAADVEAAMDWLVRATLAYDGIDTKQIEFIPETLLWQMDCVARRMPSLLYSTINSVVDSSPLRGRPTSKRSLGYYFDVILGIIYESVIKPEFVFFAGCEAEHMRDTRARASLSASFGPDHRPPIILRLADIPHHASDEALSTDTRDDPFCNSYPDAETTTAMEQASFKYIKQVLAANSIYRPVSGDAGAVVQAFHRLCACCALSKQGL